MKSAKYWLEFSLDPFEKPPGGIKEQMIFRALLGTFVALLLISFALLAFGDRINAQGAVVTRFMARSQAPLSAHFYSPEARDRISVLLYDPEFLRTSASAWPISYGEHAQWLLRITEDPNARPKAVMLDVTFGQERDDASLPQLQQALCTIQGDYGVPVFLAALPSAVNGKLYLRRGLSPNDPQTGKPCFTPVDVSYTPDPLDGLAWSYGLRRHLGADGWVSGHAPEGKDALDSAALAIAQSAAGIDLKNESEPMALMWGLSTPELNERPELFKYCRPGHVNWWRLVPGGETFASSKDASAPICPYHSTLSMARVGSMEDEELAPFLAGRFVFIGAFVPGHNDFVNSPVHGLIPGVYLHAMALDNLLSYGDRYKLATEWSEVMHSPDLWMSAAIAVFVIVFVRFVWTLLYRWAVRRHMAQVRPMLAQWAWYGQGQKTLALRLCRAVFDAAIWFAKLSLQAAAALLLTALLQWILRIGMLPVTELVAMALVAEGVHVMARISRFLKGDEAGATQQHST